MVFKKHTPRWPLPLPYWVYLITIRATFMKHAYVRHVCCAALTILGAAGTYVSSAAEPAPRTTNVTWNIPAQPLGDALTAFAQQSGLQVMVQTQLSEKL